MFGLMKDEKTRKWICIPAYIIVALCALYCAYADLGLPYNNVINRDLLYFHSKNPIVKNTVNIILLIAALVTLNCAIGWMLR